jgi:hypothetical protein
MRDLEQYAHVLAYRLQQSWEDDVKAQYRQQLDNALDEDLRGNLQMHVLRQHSGQYDFGRHYRVKEKEDRYQIVYDCNVTGMPMIHCVINKATGDVARSCIKLIEEPFFQYNLMDPGSRLECLSNASFDGQYLR